MAARASWSGYLKVSLLSLPVKAYAATTAETSRVALRQLHASCGQRVRHPTICPDHGALTSEEIVSGYEVADGEYVVLTDDELKSLDVAGDPSIEIESFVPSGCVDPIYFSDKSWYLAPADPAGRRLYALLQQGMNGGACHAIGQAVIARRKQPVLLRTFGPLIGLTVLRYASQVTNPESLEEFTLGVTVSTEEQSLVNQLIRSLRRDAVDLNRIQDERAAALTRLIESKSQNRIRPTVAGESKSTPDDGMMELLRRSLGVFDGGVASGSSAGESEAPATVLPYVKQTG